MPSKYARKRKHDLDEDTSGVSDRGGGESSSKTRREHRSRSPTSKKSSRRDERKSPDASEANEESLSIEDTNKLRAELGLDPLEMDKTDEVREGENGETIFVEHGIEIVHKVPKNLKEEKAQSKLVERLEIQKQTRQVYSKVLKTSRTLAESDSEDETGEKADTRVNEQLRLAAKKAKELEELDYEFGVGKLLENTSSICLTKKRLTTSGLTVGHSIKDFMEGKDVELVLQDKGVLDEEDDEVLINPNLVDKERLKKNIEARKRQSAYGQYSEEIDEYGQIKRPEILAKYDEGIDGEGKKRETFKLDTLGNYNLAKEELEAENQKKLFMQNKSLESLGSTQYTLAREFYTEEEMIKFRKPKKKKTKTLKALDILVLEQETEQEKMTRMNKLMARRGEQESIIHTKKEVEEGEICDKREFADTDVSAPSMNKKWKSVGATVDVEMLKTLTKKNESEEDSDDEKTFGGINLMGVVIDDDAEEELNSVLNKVIRQKLLNTEPKREMKFLRNNDDNEMNISVDDGRIVFDATSEQYKSIGENFYDVEVTSKVFRQKYSSHSGGKKSSRKDNTKEEKSTTTKIKEEKPTMKDDNAESDIEMELATKFKDESSDDERSSSPSYTNILGEKDVTKGVAAMLKLAGQKGYLESSSKKTTGDVALRQMLESKRFSKVEQGRYDIEDKTMRKLERMGTTGTGPVRSFPEKKEYKPQIEISYADEKGRLLDSKEAFRVLSWKFHGKAPGKKQIEKRKAKFDKKEKLKKMNSMDTPLGTLSKQLKKQQQLQTPYLILSGSGRDTGAPLQKD